MVNCLAIFGTICVLGLASNGFCEDTSDPILNLMLEKGMITESEAAKVKAEAEAIRTNEISQLPESKWKIGDGIKNVELFGDVRLRYEDREAQGPSGGKGSKISKIDLQRYRYALRFGLRGEVSDDFYYGFRLETSSNPRSSWVTLGSSTSGSSGYQGPFGKSNDTLDIGQAYLGWRPESWIDLTVGKMPNPLYTTPMVWDGDINPEGAAEHFKYTVGDADLFVNFGQFLYADFNPTTASSGLGINGLVGQNTEDIFMFAWQGGLNYHITASTSAKIAATLYNYTGLKRSSQNSDTSTSPYFGDPYVGEGAYYYYGGSNLGYAPGYGGYSPGSSFGFPGYESSGYPFNQVGLNDLLVVEIPFEFNFKISKLAAQVFGDMSYNLDGAQRAEAAAAAYSYILSQNPSLTAIPNSFPAQTHDVKAYQFGLAVGSKDGIGLTYGATAKKHAWEFRTYWQHIEQYALDPNIIDSDVFEGRENMQGINLQFAYGFTDNIIGMARYTQASRINDKLGTGGDNQDIPQMNPINNFQMFQIDLDFKF